MGDTRGVSFDGDLDEPERFEATPLEEDDDTSMIGVASESFV